MAEINKLEFLSKYGADKHKQGVADKVHHLVNNIPAKKSENPWGDEDEPRRALARSPLVNGEHLTKMLRHTDSDIRSSAMDNPNLTKSHIDRVVDSGDHRSISSLMSWHNPNSKKITSEHLHRVLDMPEESKNHPAWSLAYRKDLKDEHWDKLARHPNAGVANTALNGGNMPEHHVKTAYFHNPNQSVRETAFRVFTQS